MIGTYDLVQVRKGLNYSNQDYYGYILPIVKRIKSGNVDNIIKLIQTVKEQGLLDYRKVAESLDIVLD
jgi:hypothetical protein